MHGRWFCLVEISISHEKYKFNLHNSLASLLLCFVAHTKTGERSKTRVQRQNFGKIKSVKTDSWKSEFRKRKSRRTITKSPSTGSPICDSPSPKIPNPRIPCPERLSPGTSSS